MSRVDHILEKKPALFGIVFTVVVCSLAVPVIMPHILHGYHTFHILLHVTGITLSAFLAVVAAIAYARLGTRRMLLTLVAFAVFASAESTVLVDATWPGAYTLANVSLMEVGHILMICSMGMLAMGVFRND